MRLPVVLAVLGMLVLAPGGHASTTASTGNWAFTVADVPSAWNDSTQRASTLVGVVDSGVAANDPLLAGAIAPGIDLVDGTGGDPFGHGTDVAETIAGRGASESSSVGVCFWCTVLPVRVLDASGSGSTTTIAAGIRWAADHGVRVLNLSMTLSRPDDDVAAAVAYAESRNVVVVAAAGNDGADTPSYPAALPGVVSVAAVDPSRALYSWSRHGSWVTLAAPGCTVLPAASFCGTSAAAALVSGVLALGAAARPDLSAADLRGALTATASTSPSGVSVVDAGAFLYRLAPPAATTTRTATPAAKKPAAKKASRPKRKHTVRHPTK